MNLHYVYVISDITCGSHKSPCVCQCSLPHVLISSHWVSVSPLFVARRSWVEWTSPSTPKYIESHFKGRFCEALPCGWIAFMVLWIDKLCFPEHIQKTPWLFVDPTKDATIFQINLYQGCVDCICSHLGRTNNYLIFYWWLQIQALVSTASPSTTCFLGHAGAMSWFEPKPHIVNSSPSLAPSGVLLNNYKVFEKAYTTWMWIFHCAFILTPGLCLSAEMYYHLLTWTKMMPHLKTPTIILQKRNSHRRHPLPWYTPTPIHTQLWLTHIQKKPQKTHKHIQKDMSPFFWEAAMVLQGDSDYVTQHDVLWQSRESLSHNSMLKTITVWTGVMLHLRTCHIGVRWSV